MLYRTGQQVKIIGPSLNKSVVRIGQVGKILYHTDYENGEPLAECVAFERIPMGSIPAYKADIFPFESLVSNDNSD